MHLDFIFAKAKLAYQMKPTGPGWWNRGAPAPPGPPPLLPQGTAVPIDFAIGGKVDAVIITGPPKHRQQGLSASRRWACADA